MQKPVLPINEDARTRAIQKLGMIYSPSEARFDRITRLACRHFDTDSALLTIVYKETQWFKSLQGLSVCSTDREISFCGHAILNSNEPLVVENALLDSRFMDNPLVLEGPRIRFYAGQPVKDPFGVVIGTLCLIDSAPRPFSREDRQDLRDFARLVEAEIAQPADDSVLTRFVFSLTENQRSLLIDPIIGSWNRRGLEALLQLELQQTSRKNENLSLIWVKLTSFDLLLNRFGHERIVDFSKFTASIIRDNLPKGAGIGSLGADSFVSVCSGMPADHVNHLIEQLKLQFSQLTLETHGVKALVDVEIHYLTLSGEDLKHTAVQVVDKLLMLA
jgi:diguanylate cyclase (GGDEF)-like protein